MQNDLYKNERYQLRTNNNHKAKQIISETGAAVQEKEMNVLSVLLSQEQPLKQVIKKLVEADVEIEDIEKKSLALKVFILLYMVVKMKRLLFIEYYKLFRNKKNWLMILACIVLFLFIGIQNMSLDRQYMEHRLDYLEDEADSAMLMRDDLEKKMTGLDKSSKEWEQLKEEYDYWAWETEASRLLSGYYHNVNTVYGEDQKIAELSIQRNQKLIDAIHKEYTGMLYQFSTPQREVEESQKEIYIMQKLLDNNKEELKENPSLSFLYSSPYEMNGFNYLARAFDGILYIFVIMLLYLFYI